MKTKSERTLRARLISILLAAIVLFACIPSAMFASAAGRWGGNRGPIVLTNASVEFRDSKFQRVDTVDSGALFYLMITIAGNNVNQEQGRSDTYRVEITDSNLLLPNFAGNGFTDGAVYNGYTLHVNADGTRYIEFSIENGATKAIRLQAKFANGKTPDDTSATVKLVQSSTGKSVNNTITANAEMAWSASKSESRTSLTAQELTKGTTVNYTLSASPNNANKTSGAMWVESLHFEDTITLTGMEFVNDNEEADQAIYEAVASAIAGAGWTAKNLDVTNGKITFDIDSKNTNAEMGAVNLNVSLPLSTDILTFTGEDGGTIANSLSVTGKPYGSDTYYEIGSNAVSLSVSAPPAPAAKFEFEKTVVGETSIKLPSADLTSQTVKFEVKVTNTGNATGDLTLSEKLPSGMTIDSVSGADWDADAKNLTFKKVDAGETVTATINATLTPTESDFAYTDTKTYTNTVLDEETYQSSSASVTIQVPSAKISATKSGYVVNDDNPSDESGTLYSGGETVIWTIKVRNEGDAEKEIKVSDPALDGVTLTEVTRDGTPVNISDNAFTDTVTVKPGTENAITYVVTGTISDTNVPSSITNKVTVDGTDYYSNTFTRKEAKINVSKTSYLLNSDGTQSSERYYDVGDTVVYLITISNDGSADAKISVSDFAPDGVEFTSCEQVNSGNTTDQLNDGALSTETFQFKNGDKTIQYKITGTIKDNATGTITNTVDVTVDGEKNSYSDSGLYAKTASLSISKTASPTAYVCNEDMVFTIEVPNNGQLDAENVTVKDDSLAELIADGTLKSNPTIDAKIVDENGGEESITVSYADLAGDGAVIDIIPAGSKAVITITATVARTDGEAFTNTASFSYGSQKGSATTPNIEKDVTGDYKVEKYVVDADGNELETSEFARQDNITYRVKVTNNSDSVIPSLKIQDACGVEMAFSSDSGSTSTTFEIVDSSDKSLIGETVSLSNIWSTNESVTFGEINLAGNGGYVVIEYKMLFGGGGSQFGRDRIDGIVGTTDKKPELTGDGLYNGVCVYKVAEDVWNPTVIGRDIVKSEISNTFGVEKSVDQSLVTVSESFLNEFTYTITLKASASNTVNLNNASITVTDVLPDGMVYVDGSMQVGYTSITPSQNGQELEITFNSPSALTNYTSDVVITYKAKLSDAKIAELEQLSVDDVAKLTNTVTRVIATPSSGDAIVKETSASATTTFKNILPQPGFAKLAVASFASDTYYADLLNRVDNDYITAGDSLIWQVVLYNGDGKTKDEDMAELSLAGIQLTDMLPSCYKYQNEVASEDGTKLTATYKICSLNEDGSINYGSTQEINGQTSKMMTGGMTSIGNVNDDNTVTWDVSALNSGKLGPNECLVIQFVTTVKPGQEKEGVITNSGYAEMNKTYQQKNVVAGEVKDTQIWNSANYNIVGLTTESWKKITYTNQGHNIANGAPHTDPQTGYGWSNKPTQNYVQGMQGEEVTYELHILNNSPCDLENMTIIDRLPYVGDIGLVSGYDRNSAFGVTMGEITGVTVDGTTVDYDTAYSTDKTSTLTEYSKDWLGQNDVMSWNASAADAVNFRVQLTSAVVAPGEEVVITFTGTVPSYVANTGEDNIAWNSFAYSYQSEVLGDTVMVAEPAKVGVWVETPKTAIDIVINKTSDSDGTFYFALFDASDNRISDVVSMKLTGNAGTGSVTMEDIDLASIKESLTNTQADNIYLYETNAKGERLASAGVTGAASPYTITYTGNEIATNASTDQTVTVTNTKNVGEITVTKTLVGDSGDTFYFALFTKNGNNYIRYEDAAVQSLPLGANEEGTVTFKDVPKNIDFYVLETNANGVIADNDFENYTSDAGIQYKATAPTAVQAGGTCSITNTEQISYSITVSKVLISDTIKTNPTFTVGLFENANGTGTPIQTKKVTSGGEVTFDGLDADQKYYIFELDADGKAVKNGSSFTQEVTYVVKNEETKKQEEKTDSFTLYPAYNGCGDAEHPIVLDAGQPQANAVITNSTDNPNQITVTKKAVTINAAGTSSVVTNHEIAVGLYVLDTNGNYVQAKDADGNLVPSQTVSTGENGTFTVTFKNLRSGVTYYVFELAANGKDLISEGSTTVVDDKTFVATYSDGNSQVVLEGNVPGVKNITDTHSETVSLSFTKLDVNGNPFSGAELTITDESGAEKANWTTDGTDYTITLDPGKYTLTERAIDGFASVSIPFEVGDDGYLKTTDAEGKEITGDNYAITADSLTVFNRSVVSVSKQDFAGKELAGAKIQITLNDASTNLVTDLLTLTRTDTAFQKVDQFSETADLTEYTIDGKTLTFYSDEKGATVITGLPDGNYTMTEITAPDGYTKAESLDFTIQDGKVSIADANEDYDVTGNEIIMKDSEENSVSISKLDATKENSPEIAGAELQVISETELDTDKIVLTRTDADGNKTTLVSGEDYTISEDKTTITFTSADVATQIYGLTAGTYTLKETTAPDGYQLSTEEAEFTIGEDGSVTGEAVMKDQPSKVSISKMDITGKTELAGAALQLTGDVDWTTVMAENTGLTAVMDEEDTTKQIGVQWESAITAKEIRYLPDGTYTLAESDADGSGAFEYEGKTYSVLDSTMTFTIENGVIQNTTGTQDTPKTEDADEGYYYYNSAKDANAIRVCDAVTADETVSVNISKQDIQGTEVSGAALRVYYTETVAVTDENGNIVTDAEGNVQTTVTEINVDEWESDGETTKTIEGLVPDKTYILEEIGAPNGYAYAESIAFRVDKDGNVTLENENGAVGADGKTVIMTDEALSLSISKMDINKTSEVEGAKLQLMDQDGTVIEDWTSGDAAYEIDVTKLKAGETYTLHEEGAPDGYAYAEDITFTIEKDGSVTLVGTNGEVDGNTVIMKDDVTKVTISKKDATTGEEIAGASLELYQITDRDGNALTEKQLVDKWTSEEGKSHEINGGLIAGATYELVEVTEPTGYQKAEPVEFTVNKDGTVIQVEMFDTREGEISISKVDINSSEELAGAVLQILKGEEIVESWTSGEDQDADGNLLPHTVKLDAGTYTLKEITAPEGYLTAEEITFTVDAKGKVTLADGTETGTIVMKDDYTKVKFSKQSITGDTELPGAKLQLKDSTGKVLHDWISGTEAYEIDKLAPGEYVLHEEGAPDGYAYATDVSFTVEETGEVQLVTMKDEALSVTLSKKALTGDEELAGAELSLYLVTSDENGAETGRTLVDSWISGTKAHVITIDSETTGDTKLIAGAKYVLVETGAPDGYQYAYDMYFVINKDGSVTGSTVMRDAAIGELGISKKDINGEEVIGAHLQILDENSEVIEEWDSVKEPHVVTLDAGTYTLVETIAPDGYQLSSSITFIVDAEGKATVAGVDQKGLITMTDDVVKVSISKVGKDGSASAELEGASMKLTYTGDGTLDNVTAKNGTIAKADKVITWTSGTAAVILEKIPNGSYVLEEVTAPEGYEIATKITFDVKNGAVTNVQIDENSKSSYADGVIRMFDAAKQTSTVTSTSTSSSTTTTTTTATSVSSTVSGSASIAGPTNTTTASTTASASTTSATTTFTSGSASIAGPTNTTTNSTTTSTTESSTAASAETSGTTASTATSASEITTVSSAGTTISTVTSAATSETSEKTEETTIITTTTELQTSEEKTTETTMETTTETTVITTTTTQDGIVIRKCDVVGNEIAGASLTVADLEGNLLDAWISEEGISHVITNAQIGVPYCLTETLAPVDFVIAAPIYFQLEADGTVSILTYQLNEDGSLALDESGAPILLSVVQGTDNVVVMVDEYTGPDPLTTPAETTTTTTTTTTVTTTIPKNSTAENGEHTPTTSQSISSETIQSVNSGTDNTTVKTGGTQTTTTSKKTSSSSGSKSVSSSPKTDDMLPAILIPTGVALAAAIVAGSKRKKK